MTNTGNCLPPDIAITWGNIKMYPDLARTGRCPGDGNSAPLRGPPEAGTAAGNYGLLRCLPLPCPTPAVAAQDTQPALTFLPHRQKSDPSPIWLCVVDNLFFFFFYLIKNAVRNFFSGKLTGLLFTQTPKSFSENWSENRFSGSFAVLFGFFK